MATVVVPRFGWGRVSEMVKQCHAAERPLPRMVVEHGPAGRGVAPGGAA